MKKNGSPDAYNSIALRYVLGDGVATDIYKAKEYFTISDNDLSHFNMASLISCGYFKGTYEDVEKHLSKIKNVNRFSFVEHDDDNPTQLLKEIRENAEKNL